MARSLGCTWITSHTLATMSTTPNDSVADLGDIAVGVDGGAGALVW